MAASTAHSNSSRYAGHRLANAGLRSATVAALGSTAASAATSVAASAASKQADGAHRGCFCGHHAALPPHFCASPAHALRETSHEGCSCGPTMTSHACARAWAAPARAWASADWDCPPPEECHAQDTIRGRSLHAPWQNPCLRLHDRGHWIGLTSGADELVAEHVAQQKVVSSSLWWPFLQSPLVLLWIHVIFLSQTNISKFVSCQANLEAMLLAFPSATRAASCCTLRFAPWRRGQRPNWVQARPHCSA